jgi:hypothetical protein
LGRIAIVYLGGMWKVVEIKMMNEELDEVVNEAVDEVSFSSDLKSRHAEDSWKFVQKIHRKSKRGFQEDLFHSFTVSFRFNYIMARPAIYSLTQPTKLHLPSISSSTTTHS